MTPANMTKRMITCLGVGAGYPSLAKRLGRSLDAVGETADVRICTQYPDGCPTHDDHPFAFKAWLLWEAYRNRYDQAIWLDSQVCAQQPLAPLWEKIDTDGHFFIGDGWTVGQWCTDEALASMKLTREDAWDIQLIWAKVICLDFRHEKSVEFLTEWHRMSTDGVTFPGPVELRERPYDPKARMVYGHRHDQTAASVLVHRLGMNTTPAPGWIELEPKDNTAILGARG